MTCARRGTAVCGAGPDWATSKPWRAQSSAHALIAPRVLVCSRHHTAKGMTPAQIREGLRYAKAEGVDGLKLFGMDRGRAEEALDEARRRGLESAVHVAAEEPDASDAPARATSPISSPSAATPWGTCACPRQARQTSTSTTRTREAGGIEWLTKDGIPYHLPTLRRETRETAAEARAARGTTAGS